MRDDLRIRTGQLADAERLAVLSTQVWLHTYCTDGINSDIAQYVLSELTTERWSLRLQDPQVRILVAERGDFLVGFAAVSFGAPCPSGASSSVELQTLYVQAHCMGQGIGKPGWRWRRRPSLHEQRHVTRHRAGDHLHGG